MARVPATAETPFEDGTFRLVLTFDESYPNKPPTVKFLSKMFQYVIRSPRRPHPC